MHTKEGELHQDFHQQMSNEAEVDLTVLPKFMFRACINSSKTKEMVNPFQALSTFSILSKEAGKHPWTAVHPLVTRNTGLYGEETQWMKCAALRPSR